MAENSKIQWTHHTFNPWRGCTKVSAGCKHCYAETLSGRNSKTLGVWGPQGTRVVAAEAQWRLPLKWDREAKAASNAWLAEHKGAPYEPPRPPERPRVFCASLADVFEDWTGAMVDSAGRSLYVDAAGNFGPAAGSAVRHATMQDVRRRLFALIDATPNLDWLLLTKRPENVARMVPQVGFPGAGVPGTLGRYLVPPNVWLGTSVENQAAADERIPHLLRTPAAVRFLSCEPLLGPVDLLPYCTQYVGSPDDGERYAPLADPGIHWVIVGGESGHDARPCRVEWIRSIVQQCKAARVPVFVKQVGGFVVDRNDRGFEAENERWAEGPLKDQPTDPEAWPTPVDVEHDLDGTIDGYQGAPVRVYLVDRKGGNPDEWPADLRVREFPTPNLERQPA